MSTAWDAVFRWSGASERAALGRVVDNAGSGPRTPGTAMAVAESGPAVGSISGGCVDGELYAVAHEVIETGTPARRRFGPGDPLAPGLPCGGVLDVFVEPVGRSLRAVLPPLATALRRGEPVTLVTLLNDPGAGTGRHTVVGARDTVGDAGLGGAALDRVRALSAAGASGLFELTLRAGGRNRTAEVFVHSFPAPPRMLVFGADDFAAALTRLGRFLGYRVVLCDARPAFATSERFPDADEVVIGWPHEYLESTVVDESTVICVLTHDAKFELPLLVAALRTEAGYIGVMGSRRAHAERIRALRGAGITDTELARLAAPTGLDLGAVTAEETAVSIAAEIVARNRHGTGAPLGDLQLPIHHGARGPGPSVICRDRV